jgi:subtilase family serine protease
MGGAMKFLKAWTVLALMGSAAPALAQDAFMRLDPNATRHVYAEGTVITPSSSIPQPARTGVRTAHINVHLFQPVGMPANTSRSESPAIGPPFLGLFFETPQSIACVYDFVPVVSGCDPDTVTATLNGGSRTIVIVDAFHAPNALADLTTFSLQFGLPLPNPANFQVVYAASDGSLSPNPLAYDPGWEVEISLDIQWAHAMAPNARIILVEAVSNLVLDLLGGVKLANTLLAGGGGEISMSWGGSEFPGQNTLDATYFSTPGVVYFASSGDSPGTSWPSVSANVIAVGGTSISRNPVTGAFFGEAAWADGGGGPSEFTPKPAYQGNVKKLHGINARGVPDIAAVANPRTGVWIYVTNELGWLVVGGTSVSSPLVAGLVNNTGKFNISSNAELTQYYKTPSQFVDVVQGFCGPNTGYWTSAAWDYCTGLGAPKGKPRQ